jgi:hypothetical protein
MKPCLGSVVSLTYLITQSLADGTLQCRNQATGWRIWGLNPIRDKRLHISIKDTHTHAMRTIQTPIQWLRGALSWGVSGRGYGSNQSFTPSTDINKCSYVCIPSV